MTALKGDRHFTTVELGKTVAVSLPQRKLDYVDFTLTAGVTYGPPTAKAAPGGSGAPGAPAGPAAPAGSVAPAAPAGPAAPAAPAGPAAPAPKGR
jgi:hypothetical protein